MSQDNERNGNTQVTEIRDERRAPFWWADNELIDKYAAWIEVEGVAIYCVLARHADASRQSFPSISRICRLTKLSRPTVVKYLTRLQVYRLIDINNRFSARGNMISNVYTLLPLSEAPDPATVVVNGVNYTGDEGRADPAEEGEGVVNGVNQGVVKQVNYVVNGVNQGSKRRELEQDSCEQDSSSSCTNPARTHACIGADPLPGDAYRLAEELFGTHRSEFERYFQGGIPRAAQQDLINCLETHLLARRTITSSHIARAVDNAVRFWRQGRVVGAPRTADPVVIHLNGLINPAPKEPRKSRDERPRPESNSDRGPSGNGRRDGRTGSEDRVPRGAETGSRDWEKWLDAPATDEGGVGDPRDRIPGLDDL